MKKSHLKCYRSENITITNYAVPWNPTMGCWVGKWVIKIIEKDNFIVVTHVSTATLTPFLYMTRSCCPRTAEELLKVCMIQHQCWCIFHHWPEAVFPYTSLPSSQHYV